MDPPLFEEFAMNVKILACTAIATSLLFTACVKKEEPKDEKHGGKEPVASVENKIPKEQQVPAPTAEPITPADNANPTSTTPDANSSESVNLQAENTPNQPVAASPARSEPKPEPRREAPRPQPVEKREKPATNTTEKPATSNNTEASAERVNAPAQSDTPRAKPAPITDKANEQQSIDDAIKQAIDAATPAQ